MPCWIRRKLAWHCKFEWFHGDNTGIHMQKILSGLPDLTHKFCQRHHILYPTINPNKFILGQSAHDVLTPTCYHFTLKLWWYKMSVRDISGIALNKNEVHREATCKQSCWCRYGTMASCMAIHVSGSPLCHRAIWIESKISVPQWPCTLRYSCIKVVSADGCSLNHWQSEYPCGNDAPHCACTRQGLSMHVVLRKVAISNYMHEIAISTDESKIAISNHIHQHVLSCVCVERRIISTGVFRWGCRQHVPSEVCVCGQSRPEFAHDRAIGPHVLPPYWTGTEVCI